MSYTQIKNLYISDILYDVNKTVGTTGDVLTSNNSGGIVWGKTPKSIVCFNDGGTGSNGSYMGWGNTSTNPSKVQIIIPPGVSYILGMAVNTVYSTFPVDSAISFVLQQNQNPVLTLGTSFFGQTASDNTTMIPVNLFDQINIQTTGYVTSSTVNSVSITFY